MDMKAAVKGSYVSMFSCLHSTYTPHDTYRGKNCHFQNKYPWSHLSKSEKRPYMLLIIAELNNQLG